MSTCISRHGEYGSHAVGDDFVCTLCGVLDEDGLIEELNGARRALRRIADKLDIAQAAEPSLIADLTLRYVDAAAVNLAGALEAADAAHERLSTLSGIADGERELRAAQMERERDAARRELEQLRGEVERIRVDLPAIAGRQPGAWGVANELDGLLRAALAADAPATQDGAQP